MWTFSIIKDWHFVWDEEHIHRWDELLLLSPTSHVFFHPTLAKIWVDTYMPLRQLSPLFIWGESTTGNKALLPLVLWKRDWKGAFLHSIVPVGYSDYDYHDPLFMITPSVEEQSAYWDCLFVLLQSFDADEILLSGFREHCIVSHNIWQQDEICPLLDLSKINSEEALMAFLGTKLRGDIRRQMRRLGEMGTLRFVEYASVEDIPDGLFEQFMQAHRLKWPHAYKAPHFHQYLVSECGVEGPIHFSAMMLDDIPIAWHLGFEYNGVYYYYMPAGNPAYQKQSPVKIHLYYLILRAIDKGCVLYDHLRGDETYKSGWSDGYQYVNDLHIYSDGFFSKIKLGLLKIKDFIRS